MDNFTFHAPTKIYFGKGQINNLPSILNEFGKNVLVTYGGGSIKKIGLYDEAMTLLKDHGFNIYELSGIEPNPRVETVNKGGQLCREHSIDVVLAIGGGSTIDCSKAICGAAFYEGDAWDFYERKVVIEKGLPLVCILTLAATGSEMNSNAVISNMKTNDKLGLRSDYFLPKASILDPTYTFSVSKYQSAAGTADIMSHVMEHYFKKEENAPIQDAISESLLKVCIENLPIVLKDPTNYNARANLMWASTLGLNGLTGVGKNGAWSCHSMEHSLSAYYDITHGAGLAILTPMWMRYVLSDETVHKFCEFARNVWGLCGDDSFELASVAIDKLESFFKESGLPMTLSEFDIDETYFEEMAEKATYGNKLATCFKPLTKDDVVAIYKMCL